VVKYGPFKFQEKLQQQLDRMTPAGHGGVLEPEGVFENHAAVNTSP